MTAFLLHPAVPIVLLLGWVLWWWHDRRTPPVLPSMDRKNARPGDLAAGGSKATSKLEKRIRTYIEKGGYRTYPQGTLMAMGRDSAGKQRFFTPDILLRKPFAVVEVDPAHWHGAPEKVAEDVMRNRFYAARGLRIIRIRIDGTEALGPNDVVIAGSDFVPERDGPSVLRAIGTAKYVPASYWDQARKRSR